MTLNRHLFRGCLLMPLPILMLSLAGCASLPSSKDIRLKSAALETSPRVRDANDLLDGNAARQALTEAIPEFQERNLLRRHFRFEESISHRPISVGNELKLLIDGPVAYQAIFDSIRTARHHVHIETFILADDELGTDLKDILVELLERNVEVRIIYDSFGSLSTPDSFFDELHKKGADVHKYRPLNPLQNLRFWKIANRDHRKLLIVDGHTGFIGGMNISDVYSSSSFSASLKPNDMDNRWRDTHLQVNGPAVADIQSLFLETWTRVNSAVWDDFQTPAYFPPLQPAGNHLVRIVDSLGGDGNYRMYKLFLSAITHAEKKVWITQGYFAPNRNFIDALKETAARNVDVRLLLPGFTDSWITLNASRACYTELLKSGVKLFHRTDALLHAKSAIVDGVWSTVGSANLDYLSFVHNNEANAMVYGRDFGNRMSETFLVDQAHTEPITLEEWKKRPLKNNIFEKIATLVKYRL